MKRTIYSIISLLYILIIVSGCSNQSNDQTVDLTISSAVSMQGALIELKEIYEKENSHVKIFFNFGSSGALKQQISQGAPVDLFFSAAEEPFKLLLEKDIIDKKHSKNIVKNELVLIQHRQVKLKLTSLNDMNKRRVEKISIGTPETVPAGKYAKETLEHLKIWSSIESKVVYAKDVHQVLTYVETRSVDAGMVYRTDALNSKKVEIVESVPENTHTPIVYPLGVVKKSKQKKVAIDFYEFLQSDQAERVYKRYGFTVLK